MYTVCSYKCMVLASPVYTPYMTVYWRFPSLESHVYIVCIWFWPILVHTSRLSNTQASQRSFLGNSTPCLPLFHCLCRHTCIRPPATDDCTRGCQSHGVCCRHASRQPQHPPPQPPPPPCGSPQGHRCPKPDLRSELGGTRATLPPPLQHTASTQFIPPSHNGPPSSSQ